MAWESSKKIKFDRCPCSLGYVWYTCRRINTEGIEEVVCGGRHWTVSTGDGQEWLMSTKFVVGAWKKLYIENGRVSPWWGTTAARKKHARQSPPAASKIDPQVRADRVRFALGIAGRSTATPLLEHSEPPPPIAVPHCSVQYCTAPLVSPPISQRRDDRGKHTVSVVT